MKKIIAVLMAAAMLLAFAACSKTDYKDTVVTEIVTDEAGQAVTDTEGSTVTRVVEKTTEQNDKSETSGSTAAKESTTKKTANGKDKTTKKESTTKKTTKKNQTTTKLDGKVPTAAPAITTTTTAPANRKIKVSVQLPQNSSQPDELTIYINKKEVKKAKVKLDSSTYTFTTESKYQGDVKVSVSLKNYSITEASASCTVKKGQDTAKMSLLRLEYLEGEDD